LKTLKTIELKFLLKLLSCEGYRGNIVDLKPNSETSPSERDQTCKTLSAKGIVGYDAQVSHFSLTPPGRTLLTLDTTSLPVTPDELKVLKACQKQKGSMTPAKLWGVPLDARQDLIRSLTQRGMLKINKESIQEVWLSAQGKQFLLYEFDPVGHSHVVSATMLGSYVRFLRDNLGLADSLRSREPSAIP
jgi:hypothetical protein